MKILAVMFLVLSVAPDCLASDMANGMTEIVAVPCYTGCPNGKRYVTRHVKSGITNFSQAPTIPQVTSGQTGDNSKQ